MLWHLTGIYLFSYLQKESIHIMLSKQNRVGKQEKWVKETSKIEVMKRLIFVKETSSSDTSL